MTSSTFDEPQFLEPAHHHDPTQVSNIAAIPTALLRVVPTDVQRSLWVIQESTSVAYASYSRLQQISKERFHRLVPAKNQACRNQAIECRCDDRLACADRFVKRSLVPLSMFQYFSDHSSDSEPAFHNYINFLQAEKTHFLEEAIVDWRHKAMRIDVSSPMPSKLDLSVLRYHIQL